MTREEQRSGLAAIDTAEQPEAAATLAGNHGSTSVELGDLGDRAHDISTGFEDTQRTDLSSGPTPLDRTDGQ